MTFPIIRIEEILEIVRHKIEALQPETTFTLTGVPIQSKDKVLGILGGISYSSHSLGSNRLPLLATIGHQIGIAVENARLAHQAAEVQILREVDRLRSELIANVSHELRTPLGLIKISASSLLMDDAEFDRETQLKFLYSITDETTKLERIVEHLLDLGRIESGRLHLERQPTELGQLIRNTISSMEALSDRHRLVSELNPASLLASVDAKRIEQVLRNLLDNAIKYSPDGGKITVQAHQDDQQIYLAVSDEGIGIPADELGQGLRSIPPCRERADPAHEGSGVRACRLQGHRRGPRRTHLGRKANPGRAAPSALCCRSLRVRKQDEENPHSGGRG